MPSVWLRPALFKTALSLGSIFAMLAGYVAVSIPLYVVFYSLNLHATVGTAAFKVALWAFFALHIVLTLAISVWVMRHWNAPPFPTLVGVVFVMALLSWPTLLLLSFANACDGLSYPFGGRECLGR